MGTDKRPEFCDQDARARGAQVEFRLLGNANVRDQYTSAEGCRCEGSTGVTCVMAQGGSHKKHDGVGAVHLRLQPGHVIWVPAVSGASCRSRSYAAALAARSDAVNSTTWPSCAACRPARKMWSGYASCMRRTVGSATGAGSGGRGSEGGLQLQQEQPTGTGRLASISR
jgi:hypothetical protein